MNAETLLLGLVRLNLVASVAIALVLVLRPLILRWFGARIAYALWLVIPLAVAASFLPAHEQVVILPPPPVARVMTNATEPLIKALAVQEQAPVQMLATSIARQPSLTDVVVVIWLLGAGALLLRAIVNTRRLAIDKSVGPALVGVFNPKLVLPADFTTRFDVQEQTLILAHEEVHRLSGHTVINALIEVARCTNWFNPLAHLAALCSRTDQELACDAIVVATHPGERHAYAQALLKAQITPGFMPLGCTWTSRSARRLQERIELVGRAALSRRAAITGAAMIAIVGLVLGYAAWAQQPEQVIAREAGLDTPAGLLSPLEKMRHERAMTQAKNGNIDIILFGDSDAEFWYWPGRGKPVWDKLMTGYRADNFGAQGAHTRSTLWRMQSGELDGYRAKLVVIYALGVGDGGTGMSVDDTAATNAAIVAEIKQRQPQAKILLMANIRERLIPRMIEVNARLARLADNQTVFFDDMTNKFLLDGHDAIDPTLFSIGMRTPGFEVWASELKPWLERFGH